MREELHTNLANSKRMECDGRSLLFEWRRKNCLLHFSVWKLTTKEREGEREKARRQRILRIHANKLRQTYGRSGAEQASMSSWRLAEHFAQHSFNSIMQNFFMSDSCSWCRKSNHHVFIFVQSFVKLFDETEQKQSEMRNVYKHYTQYQISN